MMRQALLINGKLGMYTRLKGVNVATKKLANGTVATHYYLGRGRNAEKLEGKLGTPEFMASYNRALAKLKVTPSGALKHILTGYEKSAEYNRLAIRTQQDYSNKLRRVIAKFGTFPIAALTDKRTRGKFLEWRDELAKSSPKQADYVLTVFSIALKWALGRGLIETNPVTNYSKLYNNSRAESVWGDAEEASLMATASAPLQLAMQLALWTGQRQGDLLRLPWSAYDGDRIRLKQSKTGARVEIPVAKSLKLILDSTKRVSPLMMTNLDGHPWSQDGFRSSWHKACKRAQISGLTFHDLRGTAVTRLALAGCTEIEIASITGHSTSDVKSILEKHYLRRDPKIAESAIRKLEAHQK
jgi:integrase